MNRNTIKYHLLILIFFILLFNSSVFPFVHAQEFTKASKTYQLDFPKDHGAHENFETEWWYFTGLLKDKSSPSSDYNYGFQLTFFRRAKEPNSKSWDQAYLAHAAISNFKDGTYQFEEKVISGGIGVAGASKTDLEVWNHNWRAEKVGDKILLSFDVQDPNKQGKCELKLISTNLINIIKNGKNGFSKKGHKVEGSGASMYYSIAPIDLEGHISCIDNKKGTRKELLAGRAWMDHEFMTNALSKDQIGWDWLSLNFDNNDTLMLFKLRDKSGNTNFKSGTYVKAGKSYHFTNFDIKTLNTWKSQKTKATYPKTLNIKIPEFNLDFNVSSIIDNQEFISKKGPSYWEGAVKTESKSTNNAIGYLEMTGYDKAINLF